VRRIECGHHDDHSHGSAQFDVDDEHHHLDVDHHDD